MDFQWTSSQLFLTFISLLHIFNGVWSLECFKCANVTLESGSSNVASLYEFLKSNHNPDCGTLDNPDRLERVACPARGNNYVYQCGYTNTKAVAYAHLVGKVVLGMKVRGCIAVPEDTSPGCYEGVSYVNSLIKDVLPASVVTTQPEGKVCFCDTDACQTTIHDEVLSQKWCPIGAINVLNSCVHWWVFLIAVGDLFLLAFIVVMISCCCCACCPLHPAKRIRRERYLNHIPKEYRSKHATYMPNI